MTADNHSVVKRFAIALDIIEYLCDAVSSGVDIAGIFFDNGVLYLFALIGNLIT